jgi:hypothetical protein
MCIDFWCCCDYVFLCSFSDYHLIYLSKDWVRVTDIVRRLGKKNGVHIPCLFARCARSFRVYQKCFTSLSLSIWRMGHVLFLNAHASFGFSVVVVVVVVACEQSVVGLTREKDIYKSLNCGTLSSSTCRNKNDDGP